MVVAAASGTEEERLSHRVPQQHLGPMLEGEAGLGARKPSLSQGSCSVTYLIPDRPGPSSVGKERARRWMDGNEFVSCCLVNR